MRRLFYLFILCLLPLSACDCTDEMPANNVDPTNNVDVDMGDIDQGCVGPDCQIDPCEVADCRGDQTCIDDDGVGQCVCPAGTTDSGTACEADTTCLPTTCNEHGTCTEGDSGPECSCDTGWAGDFCGSCDEAAGFQMHEGECTDNPCDLLNCEDDFVCVVTDGTAACECPAGTHLEGDRCSVDQTCSPTSCAGNGTCTEDAGTISCVCQDGWAQPFCQDCDSAGGYHPDGNGGCTTDPCLPNPCTMANKTTCNTNGPAYECVCDAGYHDDNGACVPDEFCETGANDSCNNSGTCDDTGGVVSCTCNPGYVGDACDQCDMANGYHDDGNGTCTQDPCLPNPCMDPNKTVCSSSGMGTAFACACDAGFHPDGNGGCTDDPCIPNTCAATNQACRVTNGMAECYTPTCNDNNPCTDDVLVQGVCQFNNLADGSPCTTTECTDGQTCSAGVCGGGSARVCDDSNDCTADSCDDILGCEFTNDDNLVPDDGIACTTDSCSGGVASNVPNDSVCDDGQWCTGDESCAPANPSADAQGCIATNVPVAPPAPSPCQYYGACDNQTQSFSLISRQTGSACNDGVYCTTGDTCNAASECVGSINPNCGATTCASTAAFPNVIDVPSGKIIANFTIGGSPLPANHIDSNPFRFYAVAQDTGVRHLLGSFEYDYSNPNALEGPWITDRLIPGIYDILLDRYPGSRSTPSNLGPYAERILMSDVVITSGTNTLNIDIPQTTLTINYTIGGQPLPANHIDSNPFRFFAIAKDTGVRHLLGSFEYDYSNPNALEGPWNTDRLIPGTYDILLDRYPGSRSTPSNLGPYAERVLIEDLVISGASQTINIDVPQTTLTINYTIAGAPLPANSIDSNPFRFYAVAKDTGVRHLLGSFEYDYSSPNALEGPWNTDRLIPGTYDILLDRYPGSRSTTNNLGPYAERVLIPDLVISGASQTINIDVPETQLTINYTIGGQPLPANSIDSNPFRFYAVAKDTGVRHLLGSFEYDYSSPNALEGPWNTDRLIPGTYDILLDRYPGSRSTANNLGPYAERVLMADVEISGSSQTLNIDVPQTTLTINYTIDGAALPSNHIDSNPFRFYAVAQDTGVRHLLGSFEYDYSNPNELEGPWNTDRLIPGTYDILLDRYPGSRSTASNLGPYGERVLIDDLVISGASQTINVDVPSSLINVTFTIDGQALPANHIDSNPFRFYAVSRDTGVRHLLGSFEYDYSNPNELEGPWMTHRLIPGTYDVLLDRYPGSRSTPSNLAPYGERYLGVCWDL